MAVVCLFFSIQTIAYGLYGDTWAYAGFVEDIKREVKPNERIFMEDVSGRLAVLTQRRFVPGDGLVGSNEYLHRYLANGLVGDYLADHRIEYFLTSNTQCFPYRKVMPWTRTIDLIDGRYRVVVDLSYLTRLPLTPSVLYFGEPLIDKCVNGIRELLFRVQ